MEAFDDLLAEERIIEQDWQDFGDHVRAEGDRKARVLSSIQSAMRERLDGSATFSELMRDDRDQSKTIHPSADARDHLFEAIPDPYPHSTKFQRVIISESGEDVDTDTLKSCKVLDTCMGLREKWLADCSPPLRMTTSAVDGVEKSPVCALQDGERGFRRRPHISYNVFDRKVPESSDDYSYMMVRGVFEVRRIGSVADLDGADCIARSFEDFISDFTTVSLFYILLYMFITV